MGSPGTGVYGWLWAAVWMLETESRLFVDQWVLLTPKTVVLSLPNSVTLNTVAMTSNHRIISLWLQHRDFATVMNHSEDIIRGTGLLEGSQHTGWEPALKHLSRLILELLEITTLLATIWGERLAEFSVFLCCMWHAHMIVEYEWPQVGIGHWLCVRICLVWLLRCGHKRTDPKQIGSRNSLSAYTVLHSKGSW